jgi:outer membrane protein assembly factor BamB/predicted phosphodiesterase
MTNFTLLVVLLLASLEAFSQQQSFRFAFISDTHINESNSVPSADLRRTVSDINAMNDIAFVVLTGDITELGTERELKLAKQILDSLDVPFHIIPGNHDTGWSESGGLGFTRVFGSEKFVFDHQGVRFMGCASGPYVRMSDGHVPRSNIIWMDSVLRATRKDTPVIFLNHYPIDKGLDNWYEITDRLRPYTKISVLCGHGHRNLAMDFEDIPGTMGRSNLRAKAEVGGYNLVDVRADSIFFSERKPGIQTLPPWRKIAIGKGELQTARSYPRPDFDVNTKYPGVKPKWTFSSEANVISTPLVAGNEVIFGNQSGVVKALSLSDGSEKWSFSTSGPIFSSPARNGNNIVLASADGYVYSLNSSTGKLLWKYKTEGAVLGSPLVHEKKIFIGGSDGHFRCLDGKTGKELWYYAGLRGPVVSTPIVVEDVVIFGAWDTNLYALNWASGALVWKWNNGSPVRHYSPASCTPVTHEGVLYLAAPDRFLSAIDAAKGTTLWRTKDGGVRESIGISNDGHFVYAKSMQDTLVAYATGTKVQKPAWKMNVGFGYEHVPSMLIDNEGQLFFGTKNGVVYAIDPARREIVWAHKIDNSMVNTVRVLDKRKIIASTMDGKVVLLHVR